MKKKLLIGAIAVCLIAVIACGSLAYFTANKNITNKFYVAGYDPDNPPSPFGPDDVFSIVITEDKPGGGTTTGPENTYTGNKPGDVVTKNPKVTNTGSVSQWVRVKVAFDKVSKWNDAGITAANLFSTLVTSGYKNTLWDTDAVSVKNDVATFTFYLKAALPAKESVLVFDKVTIPASLTTEQMVALNGFTVKVTADAIQSANTGASAKATFNNPTYWND